MILWYACLGVAIALPIAAFVYVVAKNRHASARTKETLEQRDASFFSRTPLWEQLLVALSVAFIIGSFFLVLPATISEYSFFEGLLDAIHSTIHITILHFSPSNVAGIIHSCGLQDTLATIYVCVVEFYSIVSPLVFSAAAIGIIAMRLPFWQIKIMNASGKNVDAYVFFDINERSTTLAADIIRAGFLEDRKQVLIFGNCSKETRNKHSSEIKNLKSLGNLSVVFLDESASALPPSVHGFKSRHFFTLSDDSGKSIGTAIAVLEAIVDDALATSKGNEEQAAKAASACHVYCLHNGQEDELIFDSMAQYDGDNSERTEIRRQIELRLFIEAEERVRELLLEHPLYEVLEPVDCSASEGVLEPQELQVVVIGLGAIGIEAVRSSFWLGRAEGIRLRILAIDKDAKAIERRMRVRYPEMMRELDGTICAAEPLNPLETSLNHTVTVRSVDAMTDDLENALREIPVTVAPYVFVALGDDFTNLEIAIRVKRHFDERILPPHDQLFGRETHDTRSADSLPDLRIAFCIEGSEVRRMVANLISDKGEQFGFTPFGDIVEVYTYKNLVGGAWEHAAQNVSASYARIWMHKVGRMGLGEKLPRAKALADYNKYEIKKASNRACALHIPYRLWALGLHSRYEKNRLVIIDADNNIITWSRWLEKLGIYGTSEEQLSQIENIVQERETIEDLRLLAKQYPVIWAMAKTEHDRWTAFYQAQGWKGLSPESVRAIRKHYPELRGDSNSKGEHQSPMLRRHCYIADFETMIETGYSPELEMDVNHYDRAFIIDTYNVLLQQIVE